MDAKESILSSFDEEKRNRLIDMFEKYGFSESLQLETVKEEADLVQWKEKSIFEVIDFDEIDSLDKGRRRNALRDRIRAYTKSLRESETDYSTFPRVDLVRPKKLDITADQSPLGFGKCPCPIDGEVTRCCKLTTLDAVTQCAFACSYCSVQAFYNENRINIISNLSEKLEKLEIPEGTWHVGTGQASDSLFLADDYGTLSALADWAEKHPELIIESKSKAGRKDSFERKYPENMIFSWSLNAPTVIEKEEHLTATLNERLECAERARDNGNLVGFHIHPMVYFKGWEEEYRNIAEEIERRFSPDDICMISSGTLIFTKENMRYLREKERPSRVLEMPLVKTAGKYSYPLETREKMFTHLFSCFSKDFKESVFTYLCLEDPRLWMPALGREYKCDKDFEMDMKKHYEEKVAELRKRHSLQKGWNHLSL